MNRFTASSFASLRRDRLVVRWFLDRCGGFSERRTKSELWVFNNAFRILPILTATLLSYLGVVMHNP